MLIIIHNNSLAKSIGNDQQPVNKFNATNADNKIH